MYAGGSLGLPGGREGESDEEKGCADGRDCTEDDSGDPERVERHRVQPVPGCRNSSSSVGQTSRAMIQWPSAVGWIPSAWFNSA